VIDYNWTIVSCEREAANGGITLARWSLTATDGDRSVSTQGGCGFTPDPAAPGFMPYGEVTEAQVLGWCWAGGLDKAVMEAFLAAQINAQIEAQQAPATLTGVPWRSNDLEAQPEAN
jgi:hypothetical protein